MANTSIEYSFLSKENFYQIVENHLNNLSKPERSVITKETADRIISLIENNFEDEFASRNLRRWARQFIIKNINGSKFLYKQLSRKHQKVEVPVCIKEEMYYVFCRIHNGDAGEGHRGQNATWSSINQQYCFIPQSISNAACKACSVCCASGIIRQIPEGKAIISKRFLQRVQVNSCIWF